MSTLFYALCLGGGLWLAGWNLGQRRGRDRGWADRALGCAPESRCDYCTNPVLGGVFGGHRARVRAVLVSYPALAVSICAASTAALTQGLTTSGINNGWDVVNLVAAFVFLVALTITLLYFLLPAPLPALVQPRWVQEEGIVARTKENAP